MNEWIKLNEALWLFWLIFAEALMGLYSGIVLTYEYLYDKKKDDIKKQRKTKTTKKTTTQPSGVSVVEESTETSEPVEVSKMIPEVKEK